MIITDSEGMSMLVTDLDAAIEKADNFRTMQHDPPTEFDKQTQEYWEDIYQKLIKLKIQQK